MGMRESTGRTSAGGSFQDNSPAVSGIAAPGPRSKAPRKAFIKEANRRRLVRTLVTGSSGQVGSSVIDEMRRRGTPSLGLDLRASQWTDLVADVRTATPPDGIRAIVHCAAQVSVARSVEDPRTDAAHNVDGTIAALEMARRRDVERFVFISSAAVYGNPSKLPVEESATPDPFSPYGLAKLVGERYVELYQRLYGVPTVALRPFNIYSARQDPTSPYSGVITAFARAARQRRPPTIYGTGNQTRDFVHVDDVVQAILLVANDARAVGGVFNVATGKEISIRELADLMLRLAAAEPKLGFAPPRPADIDRSVASVGKLRALGFVPRVPLEKGLLEILSV